MKYQGQSGVHRPLFAVKSLSLQADCGQWTVAGAGIQPGLLMNHLSGGWWAGTDLSDQRKSGESEAGRGIVLIIFLIRPASRLGRLELNLQSASSSCLEQPGREWKRSGRGLCPSAGQNPLERSWSGIWAGTAEI